MKASDELEAFMILYDFKFEPVYRQWVKNIRFGHSGVEFLLIGGNTIDGNIWTLKIVRSHRNTEQFSFTNIYLAMGFISGWLTAKLN